MGNVTNAANKGHNKTQRSFSYKDMYEKYNATALQMINAVAKSKKKLEFHLPYCPLTFHAVHAPINLAGKLFHTSLRHRSLPLSLKGRSVLCKTSSV